MDKFIHIIHISFNKKPPRRKIFLDKIILIILISFKNTLREFLSNHHPNFFHPKQVFL